MSRCTTIPAEPAVEYAPPRYLPEPSYGWDSGANSTAEVDGDLHATFDMRAVTGVVVGLFNAGDRGERTSDDRERIRHGLNFHRTGAGSPRFAIFERGAQVTPPAPYSAGDAFTIRRVGTRIEYLHKSTRVFASRTESSGPQIVGCCIYASEDVVPGRVLEEEGGDDVTCFWTDLWGLAEQECEATAPEGRRWLQTDNGMFYGEWYFDEIHTPEASPPPGFDMTADFEVVVDGGEALQWVYDPDEARHYCVVLPECRDEKTTATLIQGSLTLEVTYTHWCS